MVAGQVQGPLIYQSGDRVEELLGGGCSAAVAKVIGAKLTADLGRRVVVQRFGDESVQGERSRIVDDRSRAAYGGFAVQCLKIISAIGQDEWFFGSEVQEVEADTRHVCDERVDSVKHREHFTLHQYLVLKLFVCNRFVGAVDEFKDPFVGRKHVRRF